MKHYVILHAIRCMGSGPRVTWLIFINNLKNRTETVRRKQAASSHLHELFAEKTKIPSPWQPPRVRESRSSVRFWGWELTPDPPPPHHIHCLSQNRPVRARLFGIVFASNVMHPIKTETVSEDARAKMWKPFTKATSVTLSREKKALDFSLCVHRCQIQIP